MITDSVDGRHFAKGDWEFATNISHIMHSKCSSPVVCRGARQRLAPSPPSDSVSGTPKRSMSELVQRKSAYYHQPGLCTFCKYDLILGMAHFPDMTYAANWLRLRHRPSGLVAEFNALDALMPVIGHGIGLPRGLKVSPSEAWLRARVDSAYVQNVLNADFDWTFSSDYRGSWRLAPTAEEPTFCDLDDETAPPLAGLIEPNTAERINLEKLRERAEILFFDEIDLFEDELADHGVAKSSVKIRVMPDSFFVLQRYFLRVDNVYVRFYDTRLYHEFGRQFVVRELTNSEAAIDDLSLPEDGSQHLLLTNPGELFPRVPVRRTQTDLIRLPAEPIKLDRPGAS